MRMLKSILLTLVCALAILAVGYGGIIFIGEQVLKSPQDPQLITMTGNISNLFYSELEDDIQLYPWNYYPQDDGSQQTERQEGSTEMFADYSPYLENNVFYTLISVAADVDPQEVSRWYDEQEKTITTSMKQGKTQDGEYLDWYFYDDVIRLNGKEFQVKIACSSWSITSFSCIQCRDEGVKETDEWNENKERFISWMKENPDFMMDTFYGIYDMYASLGQIDDWYVYVELYQNYLDEIHYAMVFAEDFEEKVKENEEAAVTVDGSLTKSELEEKYGIGGAQAYDTEEGSNTNTDTGENAIQVIELKDSVLLVMEEDITIGLYYDVIDQRITGFHFFYE